MRSREFITWFGDYDENLREIGRFVEVTCGRKAQALHGSTVPDNFLTNLMHRWLTDVSDAPSVHLALWGMKAEIEWLVSNIGESGLEHFCSMHDMAVRPQPRTKPYTAFFTELYELLDANLLVRPEATADRYYDRTKAAA